MKGGHKKVIQLLENWSGTVSKQSEMGSKYLLATTSGSDPTPKDYSPASTVETAVSLLLLRSEIVCQRFTSGLLFRAQSLAVTWRRQRRDPPL